MVVDVYERILGLGEFVLIHLLGTMADHTLQNPFSYPAVCLAGHTPTELKNETAIDV